MTEKDDDKITHFDSNTGSPFPLNSDPHYYEKLLLQMPNNPYVLSSLAYKYEFQAKDLKITDKDSYKKKLKQSLYYFQLASENGYQEAEEDIERIKGILRSSTPTIEKQKSKKNIDFPLKILASIISLLIFFALTFLSPLGKEIEHWIFNNDVTINQETTEPSLDSVTNYYFKMFYFDDDLTKKEMVNELLPKILKMQKTSDTSSLELSAVQEDKIVFSLFSLPKEQHPILVEKNIPLNKVGYDTDSLSLTVIRSALYQYVLKNGSFPGKLETLHDSFPNNFISEIPSDTIFDKNEVKNTLDFKGGWLYTPPIDFSTTDNSPSELRLAIAESLNPNFTHKCNNTCSFSPLEIHINKEQHLLRLSSDNKVFELFQVGLGKKDTTPEGTYQITKRVSFPNNHDTDSKYLFGTRGLELSDPTYAIHGTYDDDSIGRNHSDGCIRLHNSDIEKLFSMTPLNTSVFIWSGNPKEDNPLQISSTKERGKKRPREENNQIPGNNENSLGQDHDPNTIYNWAQ